MALELREYQIAAIQKLREGFAAGHHSQVLYLGTGGGKTEIAIAMLEAAKKKGSKAAMLLDRIVLCDQTSSRIERYGIAHGVLQAGHWRYRPDEDIQVCSAQTIEKRGEFPGLDLLIIDECHTQRAKTTEFVKNNPHIKVIGLTATPFTKGMGKIYSNVVSTITTEQLVSHGNLVPLRVYIAKEINMDGAKKVAGEWSQAEATSRGIKITGDVVAEWVTKTLEVFGEPRKTIVFSAGVDHGVDLAKNFQEKGFNFICISYKDDDQYKRDVIEEFSKPDTKITGLIATDILTKGFDVPDVMIGISARPFSKSLSSHIQQMGRVMRSHPGKEFALWLDHSGNYLRFRNDWDDVYNSGVSELDDGKEKTKKEPTEKEKEASKCPACKAFWPSNSDTCICCGFVRVKLNIVQETAGSLQELKGAMSSANKQEFWSMLQWYVLHTGKKPGWAAHSFREKFGAYPRGLNNTVVEPSIDVASYVDKKTKNYVRRLSYAKRMFK